MSKASVSHFSRRSLHTINRESDTSLGRDQVDIADIFEQYHLQDLRDSKKPNSIVYTYLKEIDPLDLLGTIKDVRNELIKVRLEICIFHSFFMKHDNKVITLLLTQQKLEINDAKRATLQQRFQSTTTSLSRQSATSMRKGGVRIEYALNYMHKKEMAERLYREKDTALKEQELASKKDLCDIRAQIEEQQLRRAEVIATEKNFLLHFGHEYFQEQELWNKLSYFTRCYVNFSADWMSSIRLRLNTLSEDCRVIIDHIRIKKDKRMSLTTADLESIEQRLESMNKEYNGKVDCALLFKHNVLIKTTEMNKESKALSNDHKGLKHIIEQTVAIEKSCKHMNRDLKFLSLSDDKHRTELFEKKEQSLKYKAPSTDEYLTIKEKGSNLLREVETLRRKIDILNINLPKSEQIIVKKAKLRGMFF